MATPTQSDPVLYSFGSKDDVVNALAAFIVKAQKEALAKKGRFTIALSGGSLPSMLKGLINNPAVKWDKWQVFYADERAVPLDDPDSNHLLCTRELYAHVPLPPSHIHTLDPALLSDLDELADAYAQTLVHAFAHKDTARFPRFDLVLLGVGPDGHTASLFPRHALLQEDVSWVAPIEDAPKPPPRRITLTLPVINHAVRVAFVATGEAKAELLPKILDARDEELPAALVKPVHGHLYWFVDDAASKHVKYPKSDFDV